jgi:WD40 repeat protein
LSETLWQIGCRDPQRPTALRPDLDPRLEAIVMKAMAKRPADRYPTMDGFAGALDDFLNAPTVPMNRVARHLPAAEPTVALPVPRRTGPRRWWIAGVAAAVLLAGVAGVLILSGQRDGKTGSGGDPPVPPPRTGKTGGDPPPREVLRPLAEPKFRATIGPTERSGWVGTRFWRLAPDGHTFAYADRNSDVVELWDAKTAKKLASLPGHSRDVSEVAFSPDCARVAVGSHKQVKVWGVKTAKELYTITDHDTNMAALAFSPDGKHLYSIGRDGVALTTDADTGTVQQKGKVARGSRPRFTPDLKTFAQLGESPMEMFETATWEKKKTARDFSGYYQNAKFTSDSKRILYGKAEDVVFYNLETSAVEPVHKLHTSTITSVDLSADGKLVASAGGHDHTVILWDLEGKKERAKFTGFTLPNQGKVWVRFSPDGGTLLAWGDENRSVRRFDTASGKELTPVGDFKAGVDEVFFCQGGKTLAVQDEDGKMALYEAATEGE